jgi:hypothetical protein
VASLEAKLGRFDLLQTGLPQQVEIFDHVAHADRPRPARARHRRSAATPEAMLRALCEALGVPFSTRMLSWPAGRRPPTAFGQILVRACRGVDRIRTGRRPPRSGSPCRLRWPPWRHVAGRCMKGCARSACAPEQEELASCCSPTTNATAT